MNTHEEKDFSSKYDFGIWKNLAQYLKPFKKNFVVLACFMAVLAGTDVLIPYLAKFAIDHFIGNSTLEGFHYFVMVYVVAIVTVSVLVYLFIKEAGKIEAGVTYSLRKKGFKKLQELSFSYFDKTAVGWLMARMTSDTNRIGEILAWGLVDFMWGICMMSMIAVVMLILNWKLALITLTVVPVLVVVSIYFQKKILSVSRKVRKINSKITGAFNEGITGAKTTKTLVREDENLNEFKDITFAMRNKSVRSAIISSMYMPIVISLGSVGMALALGFGSKDVVSGSLSLGTLLLFVNFTVQFYEPIREMSRILQSYKLLRHQRKEFYL